MSTTLSEATTDDSTIDDLFDALSDVHRRRVLLALRDDGRLTDRSVTAEAFLHTADDATRLEFHHRHLPQLDDDGFVEWDRDAATVARGPRFEAIRPLLTRLDGTDDNLVVWA